MIGTIRKHSAWLWWVVAGLTIISFVIFMGQGNTRTGGGRNAGYGFIYGKAVTPEEYTAAWKEFQVFYWMRTHEFPNLGRTETDRAVYERLLLSAKAKQLGIHIRLEDAAMVAQNFVQSLKRDYPDITMPILVEKVLQPRGLDAADLERVIVSELTIGQLESSMGLPGGLVTPQQASELYDRNYQELSVQAVFFSASNYLAQATPAPAEVAFFYTNAMGRYRVPDRVQLYYLSYELSNYLAAAEQKLGRTNLETQVEAAYRQYGMKAAPNAKTPEEAKAKIRQELLHNQAGLMAVDQARQFVTKLFAMEPVAAENMLTLAKSNGLTVNVTAPFTQEQGPVEFAASADLVKLAFKLNAESPYSKPIATQEAVYVIGLAKRLPSSIPALEEIRKQVTEDYKYYQGALKAMSVGTNFYYRAVVQIAGGKTFGQAATEAGLTPVLLPPFSLATQELPEVEDRVPLATLKQAAFSTTPGHLSSFEPTREGGFVLYVQSVLPLDEKKKKDELPQFMSQMRHSRQNDAFNHWLMMEENRELANTPVYKELADEKAGRGK